MRKRIRTGSRRTIVPLRFRSMPTRTPTLGKPKIDDRGWHRHEDSPARSGPVLGLPVLDLAESPAKPPRVSVQLVREFVDPREPLEVIVGAGLKLIEPANGKLAAGRRHTITVEPTSKPKRDVYTMMKPQAVSSIRIRATQANNVILATLHVNLYAPIELRIKPFAALVKDAAGKGGARPKTLARLATLKPLIRAIFQPAGIFVRWEGVSDLRFVAKRADILSDAGANNELKAVCRKAVGALGSPSQYGKVPLVFARFLTGNTAGMAWRPTMVQPQNSPIVFHVPQAVVGDPLGKMSDHAMSLTIAHELAHTARLPHPDNKDIGGTRGGFRNARSDAHVRDMVMYTENMGKTPAWKCDLGYGLGEAGWLFTQKKTSAWDWQPNGPPEHAWSVSYGGVDAWEMRAALAAKNRGYAQGLWDPNYQSP